LLLNDLQLVRENLKIVAAGWPEADAILLPAGFDNADLYGEVSQSCIWIIKYFLSMHDTYYSRVQTEPTSLGPIQMLLSSS